MALAPGTRLGVYEVTAQIGEGGMGQVYRATDTKLKRQVAMKSLPASLATDPERMVRFQREAEVLASLNHPNIAAIYGLEESGGTTALVMELVEGEDLSQRLARGAIPIEEALPIAKQIAEALEAAHEQGIIHRDLKPANIKVRADGTVKVLDFGLAKAMDSPAAAAPNLSRAATITTPAMMTGVGTILGTAAYMSPEQARGTAVDKRADIWSFGCVLYEMLTAKRVFEGATVSDTLAGVLRAEPDWTALPASMPAVIRQLLRRTLEKDRRRRLDSALAVRLEIEEALAVPSVPHDAAGAFAPTSRRVVMAVASVALLIGAAIGGSASRWLEKRPAARRATHLAIAATGVSALSATTVLGRDVAISPDGAHLAYAANYGRQLFVRAFDQLDPQPVAGAEFPQGLFFSPDGQSVGLFSEFVLKKAAINGGTNQSLLKLGIRTARGATWGENRTIIFATDDASTGLEQISEDGGPTTELTRPNRERGEVDHFWPEFLPGSQAVLFTIVDGSGIDNAQVAVLDLKTGAQKTLLRGGSAARYVSSGHLVYGASGTLRAVAFDLPRLLTLGMSASVVSQVRTTRSGLADFDVSSDGTLVYVRGGLQAATRTLVWVDREGREEPLQMPPRAYQYLRLSPDGTRVALDVRDQDGDIWIWELARRNLTRLTFDSTPDRFPVWTRDGRRVLFTSNRTGSSNVFSQASDGTGTPQQLTRNTAAVDPVPTSVSPDGAWVILRDGKTQEFDVSRLSLASGPRLEPLVHTPSSEQNGEISPDGRWLAYQANDSGRAEIWVRPFPDVNAGRWQVSAGGGFQPLWSFDGRELFYREPTGSVMRVGIERGTSWAASAPTQLFTANQYYFGGGEAFGRSYDVSRDGRRFLMIKDVAADPSSAPTVVVVQNWTEELKRLVPTK